MGHPPAMSFLSEEDLKSNLKSVDGVSFLHLDRELQVSCEDTHLLARLTTACTEYGCPGRSGGRLFRWYVTSFTCHKGVYELMICWQCFIHSCVVTTNL